MIFLEKWHDALLLHFKNTLNIPVRIGWSGAEIEAPLLIIWMVSSVPIKMSTFLASVPNDEYSVLVDRAKRIYSTLYQFDIFGRTTRERDQIAKQVVDALYNLPDPSIDFPLVFRKINNISGGEALEDFERTIIEARFFTFDFEREQVYIVQSTNLIEEVL